jgi:hypothetical protein
MKDPRKSGPATTAAEPNAPEPSANGKPSEVREVPWEKHLEIKRKIFALSDGLLRKLAEHNRQR